MPWIKECNQRRAQEFPKWAYLMVLCWPRISCMVYIYLEKSEFLIVGVMWPNCSLFFLPLLAAALVGISRMDDYWHHWQDVFAGGLLGLVVTSFCYLQFFPMPYGADGWGPHAYFRMLEESRSSAQQSSSGLHVQTTELESVYISPGHGAESFETRDSGPCLDGVAASERVLTFDLIWMV